MGILLSYGKTKRKSNLKGILHIIFGIGAGRSSRSKVRSVVCLVEQSLQNTQSGRECQNGDKKLQILVGTFGRLYGCWKLMRKWC
jgi:hypothetical protein